MAGDSFDIIVIGGGHAGCEAAHAAAGMGFHTALITMDRTKLAFMSCNPAIGGLAKGQLVREVDAMGGLIGRVTDRAMIQFRMLNMRKGPAVRSPRAQCDRLQYSIEMAREFDGIENLDIIEDTADEIIAEKDGGTLRASGVKTASGRVFRAGAVVLTAGTYLRGLMHVGDEKSTGGRLGEPSAEKLTASICALGFEAGRLKTGTPPRLDGDTIDYEKCKRQDGDPVIVPFSFDTQSVEIEQVPCYITYTNELTHGVIRGSIDRSPLFSGVIEGVGPRYCPSIEDKVVKFPDRARHQIFLEPEGRDTTEVYANGIASSMPKDVQDAFVHSIAGLENVRITQWGYAIEYDYFPPTQLKATLETKVVKRLFFAGQVNGTSGYEEAAAQGLLAGANAASALGGGEPVVLDRSEAYTGVMIDDLVTLGTSEPYRMFTSRAEYRLLLRADNADRRLLKYGHAWGLVSSEKMVALEEKEKRIAKIIAVLENTRKDGISLAQHLRRPENDLAFVCGISDALRGVEIPGNVAEQVEIEVKYAGYIRRQRAQVEKYRRLEGRLIPGWVDYSKIKSMRREAKEKLAKVRPRSIGQAARISGVSPADVSILMVHLAGRPVHAGRGGKD